MGKPNLRRARPSFSIQRSLEQYARTMAIKPVFAHTERPTPSGVLVARFALPLHLCRPMNAIATKAAQQQAWRLGKMKRDALALMRSQLRAFRKEPLQGRPFVLACRLSDKEPDKFSNWQKNPVDRLRADKHGLGLIRDDKPEAIAEFAWWEPCKRNEGCVILEVWSG